MHERREAPPRAAVGTAGIQDRGGTTGLVQRALSGKGFAEQEELLSPGSKNSPVQLMPKFDWDPEKEDDAQEPARGEKGRSLRGGKKKDRDSFYGLESKPDFNEFRDWWHRVGKQGRDLLNKAEAEEAYREFQAQKGR